MENKPDIIETIEREGFTVKRKGRSLWLSCPFHEDKTPSFKINPEKQTFHCFGCSVGGSSIDFIMNLHGLSFKDALRYLHLDGGKPIKVNPEKQIKRQLLSAFRAWEKAYLGQLTDFYRALHVTLKQCSNMDEIELFTADLHRLPIIEHNMEILFNGKDEEKYELYKESIENGKIQSGRKAL